MESDVYQWVQEKSKEERCIPYNFVEYVLWLSMQKEESGKKK